MQEQVAKLTKLAKWPTNYLHSIQWTNVSAFNGGAVAEEEDGEQSLRNDSIFHF